MALTKTPVCDFGKKAEDFKLKSIENKIISLNDIKGENATLVMFICNHCPYVKAIIKDLAKDCNQLKKDGINSVAIMSNCLLYTSPSPRDCDRSRMPSSA